MIYCVEDDDNIRELVIYTLETTGLKARGFADGSAFMEALAFDTPELILLDIMLPGDDGLELLKKLKSSQKTKGIPVIMVTAKGTEYDKVIGLDSGADDYVTKPFPMSVFQKKVSALLARIRKQSGGDCYNDGNLFINFTEMTATQGGENISFTPMEYRLLKVLTKNPQIVLTRQVLLEKLWDIDGNFVDEHALTSAISRVRIKIETEDRQYIKTVYGMGYMWIGGVLK